MVYISVSLYNDASIYRCYKPVTCTGNILKDHNACKGSTKETVNDNIKYNRCIPISCDILLLTLSTKNNMMGTAETEAVSWFPKLVEYINFF